AAGGRHRVLHLLRREWPRRQAGQAIVHVESPVAPLAELAVADDVDAGLGLLPDDIVDRVPQTRLVRRLVVGLAVFDLAQKFDQRGRPHQAADVSGEDAVVAARHGWSRLVGVAPASIVAEFGPAMAMLAPGW